MNRLITSLGAMVLAGALGAAETPQPVTDAIDRLVPGVAPSWVKPAPMAGLYEVAIGPHVFYVSADGRYLMQGDLLEVTTRVNVTRPARNAARRSAIDSLGESNMIVFEPQQTEHTVTVFTDVDCGYCAKLHREIDQYLGNHIRVRYIAFPRAGVGSPTYDTMVSVWCADDPHKAMTDAKAGREVAKKECSNPVSEQYEMGRMVGVRGTPTIVLETGDLIPGYMPAEQLRDALRTAKAEAQG